MSSGGDRGGFAFCSLQAVRFIGVESFPVAGISVQDIAEFVAVLTGTRSEEVRPYVDYPLF